MAKPGLRGRLLGVAFSAVPIADKDDEQILRQQERSVEHHPVTDLLLSGGVPGLDVREDTAAGASGRIPVRTTT